MKIKCIFLCCMFLSYITYATNYYFSESLGNDSWSGRFPVPNGNNTDGPKKSLIALNTLLDNLAKPGDSILLRRGDRWSGTNGIAVGAAQGTASNYIIISAYGLGKKPIINKTSAGEILLCRGSSNKESAYLKFQNLSLTTTAAIGNRPTGVYINESFYSLKPHHIILDSLHIMGCQNGMILYQQNILVENCLIEKNGNMNQGHGIFSAANDVNFKNNVLDSNGCGSFFVHSVYISQSNNVIFEGNEIKNADDGLKLRASTNLLIKNNRIHDMYIHTIHVGGDQSSGTKNVIIEGNIIYNSPQGLRISSESGTQTLLSENIIIRNNIFPSQVFISDNGPIKDVYFYNNLVHTGNNQAALFLTNAINPINLQIKNNIFYKNTVNINHSLLGFISNTGLNGISLDHNLYYFPVLSNTLLTIGTTAFKTLPTFRAVYTNQELNGQHGNPNFVAPPTDFHLTPTSILAIDRGLNLNNTVSFDLDGLSRPLDGDGINGAAMDIGPYEYCCIVNTKTNINPSVGFSIYPNPTENELSISIADEIPKKIVLLNLSGSVALEITNCNLTTKCNLENLNTGVYIIFVHLNNEIRIDKIIKQ
ncbi:MAG: right-handed parallel beta-helix repeat-containing protein [Saprospiraceae bacterium]|nr:right-handed parallel beta-helix repeat-containing protein [Saprospiraceae bacterium]